jgi:hypothetical protein
VPDAANRMLDAFARAWKGKHPEQGFLPGYDTAWVERAIAEAHGSGELEAWLVMEIGGEVSLFFVVDGSASPGRFVTLEQTLGSKTPPRGPKRI